MSTLHDDSIGAVRGIKLQNEQLKRENDRLRRELTILRAASECVISQAAALVTSLPQGRDELGMRRITRTVGGLMAAALLWIVPAHLIAACNGTAVVKTGVHAHHRLRRVSPDVTV